MGIQLEFKELQKKVLGLLEDSPSGLTTSEIAEGVGVNRMTMGKYLEMVQLMGAIKSKKVGPANLWFIPKEIVVIKNYVRDSLHPVVEMMVKGEKTPLPSLWDEFQLMFFKVSKMGLSVNGSANYIFYEIGRGISKEVLHKYIKGITIEGIMESTVSTFNRLNIGKLKLDTYHKDRILFNLCKGPACSGIPVANAPLCHIEAGLIAGVIDTKFPGVCVKEIKCSGLKDNLCQFEVSIEN